MSSVRVATGTFGNAFLIRCLKDAIKSEPSGGRGASWAIALSCSSKNITKLDFLFCPVCFFPEGYT